MSIVEYIGKYEAGAEVIYGIIITMTFTSVLRGYPVVLEFILYGVIFAALFCCIAWGFADGMFYSWERNYIIRGENKIIEYSKNNQTEAAVDLIEEQLDDTILRNIPPEDRIKLYEKLVHYLSTVERKEKVSLKEAMQIIFGTFLLSAGAGLIVVSPFFVIENVQEALAISNLFGILLLFGVGYFRSMEQKFSARVIFGFGSSLIGIIIAGITIVLGG
jgi:VIT1/CCC1 family predicted Fe2+/Mn2+ transporter